MSAVCAKFMSFVVGFGNSLAQGSEELWRCQIRVFLGRIFGISLASGSEETYCSQNSCLSGYSNFILSVSSLARVVNWK